MRYEFKQKKSTPANLAQIWLVWVRFPINCSTPKPKTLGKFVFKSTKKTPRETTSKPVFFPAQTKKNLGVFPGLVQQDELHQRCRGFGSISAFDPKTNGWVHLKMKRFQLRNLCLFGSIFIRIMFVFDAGDRESLKYCTRFGGIKQCSKFLVTFWDLEFTKGCCWIRSVQCNSGIKFGYELNHWWKDCM